MIDWARVRELRDEVGAEDFEEVVEIFIEEVDEVIERMQSSPSESSLEADLHFLKGSSLNLGFASFSSLCKDGEKAASEGQNDCISLDTVFDSYTKSKVAFLSELQNLD